MDDIYNAGFWKDKQVVKGYTEEACIQPPEALIFAKYKDEIWARRILDIGCGAGRTSHVLKNMSPSYMGVDASEGMVAACENKFGAGSFMRADARDMAAFKESSFDFVFFSFNGIDCVNHQDRLKVLSEVKRVLGARKLFAFSSHNRNYRHARIRPKPDICVNPITMAKNVYIYAKALARFSANRKKEVICEEYAIITDKDYGFSNLYYYIGKDQQVRQARQAGFEIIEMLDTRGESVSIGDDDSNSAWIYYIGRKIG